MIDSIPGGLRVTVPMTVGSASALLAAGCSILRGKDAAATAASSESQPSSFTVDLGAIGEADSSALTILLAWLRTARETGRALEIRHAPAGLTSLAELYGVAPLLPFSAAD